MVFTDDDGDEVEKSEELLTKRTVAVSTATVTVNVSDLVAVTQIHGARIVGEGQASTAEGEVVDVTESSTTGSVDVEFYAPDGGGDLTSQAPSAERDVEVVVEGF